MNISTEYFLGRATERFIERWINPSSFLGVVIGNCFMTLLGLTLLLRDFIQMTQTLFQLLSIILGTTRFVAGTHNLERIWRCWQDLVGEAREEDHVKEKTSGYCDMVTFEEQVEASFPGYHAQNEKVTPQTFQRFSHSFWSNSEYF